MRGGRSVESSMGFTAVDGLPMGTRTGALDPGVLLYLLQAQGWDAKASRPCCIRSRACSASPASPTTCGSCWRATRAGAHRAVELFCYSIAKQLGALAAVLGGIDAFVFTAGIGEHAAAVREDVCRRAEWLGIRLDAAANRTDGPCITTLPARVGLGDSDGRGENDRHPYPRPAGCRLKGFGLQRAQTGETRDHDNNRHRRSDAAPAAAHENPLLGKKALVVGIANKDSIAFGCARAFRAFGADVSITYLNEKTKQYTAQLARPSTSMKPSTCRATSATRADRGRVRSNRADLGQARHPAALDCLRAADDLHGRVTDCSLEGFLQTMDIWCTR